MDGVGQHFLARPGLPGDQHRHGRLRRPAGLVEQHAHGRRLADDEILFLLAGLAQVGQLAPQGDDLHGAQHRLFQRRQADRFLQEIVGAVLHRLHRHLDIAIGGDQDNRWAHRQAGDLIQQVGSITIRELYV